MDEAAGAAQVLCLKENGQDFYHHAYPLFAPGLGGGYYTAPYLYGEMLWTSIFGNSVSAFRTFLALITCLTALFLYLWLRRRASESIARWALLFASISPWVFQFARIAWDPPLAPFFLLLGLYLFDLPRRFAWIAGALAFALASYSYPPARIQVVLLLLCLPGFEWRKKLGAAIVFFISLIPMLVFSAGDPNFTARGKMLALWSDYPMNPYHDAGIFGMAWGFITQFFAHFTPNYLLFSGDHNLRHSTQSFGLLSYPEAFVLFTGILLAFEQRKNWKAWMNHPRFKLYLLLILGVASGIAPAALTWEGVPHALRSIGAWPFFAALAAVCASQLSLRFKWTEKLLLPGSLFFVSFFFYAFFSLYPVAASPWFQADQSPLGSAYQKMTEGGKSCVQLRPNGSSP